MERGRLKSPLRIRPKGDFYGGPANKGSHVPVRVLQQGDESACRQGDASMLRPADEEGQLARITRACTRARSVSEDVNDAFPRWRFGLVLPRASVDFRSA